MAPGTEGKASPGGTDGAVDNEEAEADHHLDDILPAKSKSFFRLRR
jgi:hypothetical protein